MLRHRLRRSIQSKGCGVTFCWWTAMLGMAWRNNNTGEQQLYTMGNVRSKSLRIDWWNTEGKDSKTRILKWSSSVNTNVKTRKLSRSRTKLQCARFSSTPSTVQNSRLCVMVLDNLVAQKHFPKIRPQSKKSTRNSQKHWAGIWSPQWRKHTLWATGNSYVWELENIEK